MVSGGEVSFGWDWGRLSSQVELLGIKGAVALIVMGLLDERGILLGGQAIVAVVANSGEGIATHHLVVVRTRR